MHSLVCCIVIRVVRFCLDSLGCQVEVVNGSGKIAALTVVTEPECV